MPPHATLAPRQLSCRPVTDHRANAPPSCAVDTSLNFLVRRLPFLAHLFVHLPMLLLRNLRTGNKWAKIDPCIGKLTEENGD